ncbi:hypothetical protein HK099_008007, partial [Clydaea vesicula]
MGLDPLCNGCGVKWKRARILQEYPHPHSLKNKKNKKMDLEKPKKQLPKTKSKRRSIPFPEEAENNKHIITASSFNSISLVNNFCSMDDDINFFNSPNSVTNNSITATAIALTEVDKIAYFKAFLESIPADRITLVCSLLVEDNPTLKTKLANGEEVDIKFQDLSESAWKKIIN